MTTIKIDGLFVVSYYNQMDNKIIVYPRIFTSKEAAEKFIGKDKMHNIHSVFINESGTNG